MRICVDARCLNRSHVRGIGRVLTEVIERSPASFSWILLADRQDLPFHQPEHEDLRVVTLAEHGYRYHTWTQLTLPAAAAWYRGNVLLCPSNEAPVLSKVPTVSIVHDVIEWKPDFVGESKNSFYRGRLLPRAFSRSAKLVTVSHTSAAEIQQLWPSCRPEVIYNGVSNLFLQSRNAPVECEHTQVNSLAPYILYIGGTIPRKRFDWALRVWKPFADRVKLVTLGIDPSKGEQRIAELDARLRDRIEFLDFIPDEKLPDVMGAAKCVLYPTLYEGFGLPVIESNAVGTRIFHSPCGSLAELVGPLSVSLPVDDAAGWARALTHAIETTPSETERDAARAWASQFDWDSTADAYQSVFHSVFRG